MSKQLIDFYLQKNVQMQLASNDLVWIDKLLETLATSFQVTLAWKT